MKIKKLMFGLVLCMLFLTTSCAQYATPNSLINAPVLTANENINSDSDLENVAKRFLPSGAQLLSQNSISTNKPFNYMDIDGDNSEEIVAFFQGEDKFQKGFIILKNKNSNWVKIFQKIVQCNSISRFELMNIFDENQKSLLVGFNISGLAGSQYNAYTFKNGKVEERYMGTWNKFEVLNTPDKNDKNFIVAVWQKNIGEIMDVYMIKFNSRGVYYTEDLDRDYSLEIEKYYTDILKNKPENQVALQGLIKAQIYSGENEQASASIESLLKIRASGGKMYPIQDSEVKLLQAQNCYKLKKYDEAMAIYETLISEYKDNIEKNEEAKKSQKTQGKDYGAMNIEAKLGDAYLEEGKILIALGEKDNAKDKLNNSLQLYEKLYEKGFYGEQENVSINRDLDIDTVKEQLQKLN